MKLKRELWVRRAKNGFVLKVDIEQVVVYTEKDELLEDLAALLDPPDPPVVITAPYVLNPGVLGAPERLQPEEPA